MLNPNISMYDLPWAKLSTHRWVSPVGMEPPEVAGFLGITTMKHGFLAEINGVCLVKYIVSHVNVYNISSIYGVSTLLGLPEQKSANL